MNAMKGLIYGILFSIPIWALIIWGAVACAHADPNPGCPWVSYEWYSPCAQPPPVPGITPGWVPIDGIPGTYGPHGYTPVVVLR